MENNFSDFDLSKKIKEKLKHPDRIKKELAEGKSAQEILDISDPTMTQLYQAAYLLFEHQRHEEAANAFLFLATLNPHHHEYWLGLGMSLQMCHEYESAIDAYELCAATDLVSPIPYLYLAKCLFAIHDRESALQALDLTIETADDIEEFADIKREALEAREKLLKHES